MTSTPECKYVRVSKSMHRNEANPYNPSPLTTSGLTLLHCNTCMWLPPLSQHPSCYILSLVSLWEFGHRNPAPGSPTYQTLEKHTQQLGSQLTCTYTRRANFLSRSCRKQRLKEEEGSLEKQGGENISLSMGMGLKENTAQTPDVETPCTQHANTNPHTHLYKYKYTYTQIG